MSKLEQLIEELCPNGVEYINLSEIYKFQYGTGNTIPTDGGEYPVYGSNGIVGYHHKYNSEDAPVIGHIGAYAGIVNWAKGKHFVTYNGVICTLINEKVISKFAYHILLTQNLLNKANKGSQPFISYSMLNSLKIPLPPLAVQEEIVKILDNFTELTAELTAELSARKKQYEYYRDSLLSFNDNVEWKTLGEVVVLSAGGDVPKESFSAVESADYSIPIYSNGIEENALYGWTNIKKINTPSVTISARGTIGYAHLRVKPYYPIVRLISATPPNYINVSFLYYYIKTIKFSVPTSGIPQLTIPMVSKIKIPIPPLEEQERIVAILDRFDTLVNDIKEGLPAEIEARKKQYEYYRDKLLSFKEI